MLSFWEFSLCRADSIVSGQGRRIRTKECDRERHLPGGIQRVRRKGIDTDAGPEPEERGRTRCPPDPRSSTWLQFPFLTNHTFKLWSHLWINWLIKLKLSWSSHFTRPHSPMSHYWEPTQQRESKVYWHLHCIKLKRNYPKWKKQFSEIVRYECKN